MFENAFSPLSYVKVQTSNFKVVSSPDFEDGVPYPTGRALLRSRVMSPDYHFFSGYLSFPYGTLKIFFFNSVFLNCTSLCLEGDPLHPICLAQGRLFMLRAGLLACLEFSFCCFSDHSLMKAPSQPPIHRILGPLPLSQQPCPGCTLGQPLSFSSSHPPSRDVLMITTTRLGPCLVF